MKKAKKPIKKTVNKKLRKDPYKRDSFIWRESLIDKDTDFK